MSCPGCVVTEQTGVCCGVSGSFVHMPQEFAFAKIIHAKSDHFSLVLHVCKYIEYEHAYMCSEIPTSDESIYTTYCIYDHICL